VFSRRASCGACVEGGGDRVQLGCGVPAQVGALGEVLAQQAVGVLVASPLPRASRVAEVDRQPDLDADLSVLGHLRSLVPRQRLAQLLGKSGDLGGNGISNGLGAVAGQRRPVLGSHSAVSLHGRQMQQHREPGGAFDQRADRRTVQPDDQVAFPCPGTARSSTAAGRSLIITSGVTNFLRGREFGLEEPAGAAGAQACGELPAQRPAALNVKRLVDGLVRDPHRPIIREVQRQPVSDLLRAPGGRPAPVLAATVATTAPADLRTGNCCPVRVRDHAG
jgi:hypothetical protein